MAEADIILQSNTPIDWNRVAKGHVKNHTAAECENRWNNYARIGLSSAKWTKAEDKKLLIAAKRHKFCNWDLVAKELGSRSAVMCFQRYQRTFNKKLVKS